MKYHQLAGIICVFTIGMFAWLVFGLSETNNESSKAAIGFGFGFISGLAWLILVLGDPKSKWKLQKNTSMFLPKAEEVKKI